MVGTSEEREEKIGISSILESSTLKIASARWACFLITVEIPFLPNDFILLFYFIFSLLIKNMIFSQAY